MVTTANFQTLPGCAEAFELAGEVGRGSCRSRKSLNYFVFGDHTSDRTSDHREPLSNNASLQKIDGVSNMSPHTRAARSIRHERRQSESVTQVFYIPWLNSV